MEKRTKEIGIRKILGASIEVILKLLMANFTKLVALAILLALPFAYYISDYLINMGWVYRIELGIGVFVSAILVSIASALIAVIGRSYLAAKANPVDSLRHE